MNILSDRWIFWSTEYMNIKSKNIRGDTGSYENDLRRKPDENASVLRPVSIWDDVLSYLMIAYLQTQLDSTIKRAAKMKIVCYKLASW